MIELWWVEISFSSGYAVYENKIYVLIRTYEYWETYEDVVWPISNIEEFYKLIPKNKLEWQLPVLYEMTNKWLCTENDIDEYLKKMKLTTIKEEIRKLMGDDDMIELLKETIIKSE